MKKKNKFLTFLLSCIPGLGHLYLGFNTRGGIFLFAEIAAVFFTVTMQAGGGYINIFAIVIPIIWIASMVDSMVLVDKINMVAGSEDNELEGIASIEVEKQNKKVIAMVLSIIPGAGHMFLRLQRQGIQLMTIFFMSFFLTDWLEITLFMVFVPIVWFFSLFDVMYKASGQDVEENNDDDILLLSWFKGSSIFIRDKAKFIAYALIGIGCYLLLEKIVLREIALDERIVSYIKTGVVAFLFIAGGIKLISGSKSTVDFVEGDEL